MPRIGPSVKRPPAACVVFFADGLSQAVLKRMLAAGELPNIDRLFARGGVEVENAIVCLPSLTYANAVSLITGLFPGHHGILGNQWFDPMTLEYRDYGGPLTYRRVNDDIKHSTIYDLLDDHFTLNVQCHTRKGVKHTIDQDISGGILWGLGMYQTVDRRVGDVLPRIARVIERDGRWPIVWMNYFPGLDEIGHRFGPDSPEYAAAVRNVDAQVARIAAFAQENAGVERLFLAFVTDHGMVSTPPDRQRESITPLGLQGIQTTLDLRAFARSPAAQTGALLLRGTDRCLRLHLATGPVDSTDAIRRARDACDAIELTHPASVACACHRDGPDAVRVWSAGEAFRIERRVQNGGMEYRIAADHARERPMDLFETATPIEPGAWASSRDWLNATAGGKYPDLIGQIHALLDSRRSGDVVAFAAGDWSFADRFVAGHGSCIAADMRVSHFYAGTGLSVGGKVHAARLVDVMPTLLDLLGHHDRLNRLPPIDGISIRRELESAAQRLTAREPPGFPQHRPPVIMRGSIGRCPSASTTGTNAAMKILVLIRQVPDSTTAIKIRADGEDIERAGVKMVVNPFDEFAIELAVQLRERGTPVSQISALIVGPATATATLQPPLAVGADDAIHLQDAAFDKLDELQIAAVIASVAKAGGYDLILCGKQEIDLDSGQTGPALAEFLDLPHVGACTKIDFAPDGRSFTANRRIEGAEEVVSVALPAVVTCEKGLPEMRYPSLPNLMKAKKKPVKVMTKADVPAFADIVGSVGGTEVHKLEPPPQRPPGKILKGDASETVPQLVKLLREEAKAI